MKYKILLIIIMFIMTGCSKSKQIVYENSIKNNEVNDLLAEKVQSNKTYESMNNNNNDKQENLNQSKKVKEESLIEQFDSAILKTNFGDIKVKFYLQESPITVNNFMNLAKKGFYNGTKFHRVIKNFMIQGGDPNSKDDDWSNDGQGGPGYKFQDEFNNHKLVKGSLAMANAGPNTNGSQFFIVTAETTPWLDGKHTNFGKVIDGMGIVDKIENVDKNTNDHPIDDVAIENIELINGNTDISGKE